MQLTGIFNAFAQATAPIAVTAIWQGLAVAGAVALCLQFVRRISAAQRFTIWMGGFAAITALPFVPLLLSAVIPARASALLAENGTAPHPWLQLDSGWTLALAALWLVASTCRAADLAFHSFRLRRLWRTATPLDIATAFPHTRPFKICSTQWLDRPSVIGFFAPRVLIPNWLLPRLSPDELRQIVLHESMHLARRDDWTNLFQKLAMVLFPLNPALWWLDRQLAKEREMACDETVVRITQSPRAYAACLASLAERGMAHRREALSLGAWQRRSELVDRVHRILRNHPSLSPVAARLLLGTLGCSLIGVTFGLAHCPQLVAFAPPVAPAHTSSPQDIASARLGDAVYPADPQRTLTPGARIVQARAEMPAAASNGKHLANRLPARKSADEKLLAASSMPLPHGQTQVDRRLSTPSSTDPDAPQQYIVFTAWQQIETATPPSQTVIADYDTQPVANGDASPKPASSATSAAPTDSKPSDGKSTPAQPRRTTTVTQLILRIGPNNSKSPQPTAIPIGGGWFVIQL